MTSQRARDRLVRQLQSEGIRHPGVLEALRNTPRHLFVDEALASRAYENTALPIGHGQTISQPAVVARMSEVICAGGRPERVLEIGTGSGYQAAVLAHLADQVHSVERLNDLFQRARKVVRSLRLNNLVLHLGDGFAGLPDHPPFDAIMLTAAPARVPQALLTQLRPGGVLVGPVGLPGAQQLVRVQNCDTAFVQDVLDPVSFVPMIAGRG